MKKRPILMSAPMVLALLDGTKTQTRRIIKGIDPSTVDLRLDDAGWLRTFIGDCMDLPESDPDAWQLVYDDWESGARCPYGVPGDRLWVREGIRHIGDGGSEYIADGSYTKADAWPWKNNALPSIHCPLGLSRFTLELTDVRVQRLHDISIGDILAEGIRIPATEDGKALLCVSGKHPPSSFLAAWGKARGPSGDDMLLAEWASLWSTINGRESWDANPWLWCLSFKQVRA